MEPTTMLTLGSSLASGLGQSLGGGGGPSSAASRTEGAFDASGWNVNFGSGSVDSARSQAGELGQYMPYILVAIVGIVLWRMTKKR